MIIHGDEDKNVDITHAKNAHDSISNSSLYIVKEGDHMMHATHPEEIESRLVTFIKENY